MAQVANRPAPLLSHPILIDDDFADEHEMSFAERIGHAQLLAQLGEDGVPEPSDEELWDLYRS